MKKQAPILLSDQWRCPRLTAEQYRLFFINDEQRSLRYDSLNDITSIGGRQQVQLFSYDRLDRLDRLEEVESRSRRLEHVFKLAYEYDANGNTACWPD
ncbi:MAG: hypothetical protein ACK5ME_13900 [Parahaliea sp.]